MPCLWEKYSVYLSYIIRLRIDIMLCILYFSSSLCRWGQLGCSVWQSYMVQLECQICLSIDSYVSNSVTLSLLHNEHIVIDIVSSSSSLGKVGWRVGVIGYATSKRSLGELMHIILLVKAKYGKSFLGFYHTLSCIFVSIQDKEK